MPNRCTNPPEPPLILVGTGIGFAIRRVMPTVRPVTNSPRFEETRLSSYTEYELEEYLSSHFLELTSLISHGASQPILLGTQVQCPTGQIDMLGLARTTLLVVELKAVIATEKTVGQVIRYSSAIEHIAEELVYDRLWEIYRTFPPPVNIDVLTFKCLPIIVAPGFSKEALKAMYYRGFTVGASKTNDQFSFWLPELRIPSMHPNLKQVLRPYIEVQTRRVLAD
jgi:hypothetical protein